MGTGGTGGGLEVSIAQIYRMRGGDGGVEGEGQGSACLLAKKLWNSAKLSIREPCKVTPVCSPCAKRARLFSVCPLGRMEGATDRKRETQRGVLRWGSERSMGHSPTHLGYAPQTAGARGH